MAKKKNGSTSSTSSADDFAVPEGFNINVGRERGDGWVKKQEGNVVQGQLLGRYTYENRGKKRAYYQVRLHKPCIVEVNNPDYDEEDEELMKKERIEPTITTKLEEGAVVNVDETKKLSDLEARTGDGAVYNIWFVYGKKQDIGDGQSMWNITGPRLQMVTKPSEIP